MGIMNWSEANLEKVPTEDLREVVVALLRHLGVTVWSRDMPDCGTEYQIRESDGQSEGRNSWDKD